MYSKTRFDHVEIFRKKRFLVNVKAKYFLLEIKMLDVEYKLRRLEDIKLG